MSKTNTDPEDRLEEARELFVSQWGALGGSWGVNRTMAQIHALLLVAPRARPPPPRSRFWMPTLDLPGSLTHS